jgi:hypothetical protein
MITTKGIFPFESEGINKVPFSVRIEDESLSSND